MRKKLSHHIPQFNQDQKEAIKKGKFKHDYMISLISNNIRLNPTDKYNSLYISSPPGLGKTFTVIKYLIDSGIPYFLVSGNTSMFAFGIQLATINYLNPENSPVRIYVDDCDEIFKNEPNCNTMKKLLDPDNKSFVYEKSLAGQRNNMSATQQEAIDHYSEEDKLGFIVPANNMSFIFTSNSPLPIDDVVAEARRKGKSKAVLLGHLNAIRSRCKIGDFDLTRDEHWGWIADVLISSEKIMGLEITDDDKETILNFLWNNWAELTERSIRLIEKMFNTMKMFPETYIGIWTIDYIKTR